MHAVGVVPHEHEVRRGGLHRGDAAHGLRGVDDAVGVGVFRHAPHTLDRGVGDEAFDRVHVGAVLGHGDGDELKPEALGDLEVAVIARRGAEPFDLVEPAPRLFRVVEPVGVRLRDRVIHQLERCVAADEAFLRLAAENVGKERLRLGQSGKLAVVARVDAAGYAVVRRGEHREHIAHEIELLAPGLAARHVELELLRLCSLEAGSAELMLAHKLLAGHFAVFLSHDKTLR